MLDAVEAAVLRKKRKADAMQKKARAHAKKMVEVDVALQTTLAESRSALDGEIVSYGNSKISLRTFLQEQFKSRKLLRNNLYNTIPVASEFRMKKKPYTLRMNPHPTPGANITTDMQISYLKRLLYVMIDEDLQRPLEPQARAEDTQLVRRLPVISQTYLNPESLRLKKLQEATVAAMAQPTDNPWYGKLKDEYLGKILYDQKKYYRVFAIQYVPNTGKNVYPCWEATTEPVHKDEHGLFVLHDRDLVVTIDGTKKLLKSAEVSTQTTNLTITLTLLLPLPLPLTLTLTVTPTLTLTCEVGFALAEYSNGDDVDPVKLTFADTCHAKFLQMEARQASKPTTARKRRQPATANAAQRPTVERNLRSRHNDNTSEMGTINEVPFSGGGNGPSE
jgi:hypothetical protein